MIEVAARKKADQVVDDQVAAEENAPKQKNSTEKIVSCSGFSCLNIREHPSASAKIVGTLNAGEKVFAEKPIDGWCAINGGFVRAEYLE